MDSFTQSDIWFLYPINAINDARPFERLVIGDRLLGGIAMGRLEVLGCRDKLMGYIDTYKKGMYLGFE